MIKHILVLIGISGSGKTTEARKILAENSNYIRVNRDDIRAMLFGYTDKTAYQHYNKKDMGYLEVIVSGVQDKSIREGLKANKSVIIDNTNLSVKYLKEFKKYGVPIEYRFIECDVEVAVMRDSLRDRSVGESVIRKQQKSLESLLKNTIFEE